ncbi:hypothetical protein D3C87_1676970 [compost metagenome]
MIDEPAVRVKESKDQQGKNNHGDQVGQNQPGHKKLRVQLAQQLRHQDGNNNGNYGPQRNKGDIVEQGVPRHNPGIAGLEQKGKVLESDPIASENSFGVIDILEGDKHPEHRKIAVDQKIEQARSGQY